MSRRVSTDPGSSTSPHRPSLQNSNRSPAWSSTVVRSGSLAGCPFSTFSSRDRCGWYAASSAEILPSSTRRLHPAVVVGEALEAAVPQQVGPAVADVHQPDPLPVEDGAGDCGAHALEGVVGGHQVGDPVVGVRDRRGEPTEQRVESGRALFGGAVRRAGRSPSARSRRPVAGRRSAGLGRRGPEQARRPAADPGVEALDHVDGDRGGEVAGGGPTHPVGDDQQVRAGVPGVLVVLADQADLGVGGDAELRGLIRSDLQLHDRLADPDRCRPRRRWSER